MLDAYDLLSQGRPYTFGSPLPIGYTDIDAYARRYGPHSPGAFARFVRLMRALDDEYLKHVSKKDEPKGDDDE